MFMHRISLTALAVVALVTLTTSTLRADTLADGFNAFFFNDFSATSSDVEGRVAVGGNMNVTSYSVGDKLTGAMVGGNTLVVGGNLHWGNGQVYHGNTIVGGTYTGPSILSVSPYTVTDNVSPLPVNFNAVKQEMIALSAQLAAMDATGITEYKWSGVHLTGDGTSNIQVFDIDGDDVKNATYMNYITGSAPTDATLIFNISGTEASLESMGLQSLEGVRENIIFNFYEATTLAISSIAVEGSILAPHAHIEAPNGVVWGQVIASSWNGPVQINQVYFAGELPIPDPYEPDPTTTPAAARMNPSISPPCPSLPPLPCGAWA